MKLWQKKITNNKKIEQFTIGKDTEFDLQLASYDVLGSIAHIKMLSSIGLLKKQELLVLQKELILIYDQIKRNEFTIEDGVEDIHSQIEWILTKKLGDIGKKIHAGRSRNDQILVDLKLFFRAKIKDITFEVKSLFDTLIRQSEQYKSVLMPGYTHTQLAMPSSFGLWFGAYAESLTDDVQILQAAYKVINQNPLGSAAGYGSSFPLNRKMTTQLLGFDDLSYNVIHAQMGRGKAELVLSFAIASIASTLGKLANDVILFINQNFSFISFPEALTTGSSIMPHKKNPDIFELVRAKCNQLMSLPQEIMLLTSNLISGYHRDFQLLKESLFPAIDTLMDCLDISNFALQQIIVKEGILDDPKYKYLYSVEIVNKLVIGGMAFRDAYKQVAMDIENNSFIYDKQIQHSHEGSIAQLCNEQIKNKMTILEEGFSFQKIERVLEKLIMCD